MSIQIAIVEDETVYRDELLRCVNMWSVEKDACVAHEFSDGETFLRSYNDQNDYDLVILDVDLKGKDGMTVAQDLRNMGYDKTLVFMTNYAEYMQKGYEVEAFRYFLKPIRYDDIAKCLDRVLEDKQSGHFLFHYQYEQRRIPYREIIYVSSQNHYLTIYLDNRNEKCKMPMKNFVGTMPPYFLKCHRSFAVNIHHVRKYVNNQLHMSNGAIIDVSRQYIPAERVALSSRF